MTDVSPRTSTPALYADMGDFKGVISAEGALRDFDPNRDHLMETMGPEGDTKTIWDPSNQDEVDNARRTYENLVDKGYRPFYAIGKNGAQGEPMDKFDPEAGRLILIPPLQGG